MEPLRALVDDTSATFAAVPLIRVVPVVSGVGSDTVPPVPSACFTRWYWPGASVTADSGVTIHDVPAELAYCTDQPARLTGAVPALKSSMKSERSVAPLLPPPP